MFVIAQLTGAMSVVVVLVAGLVALAWAAISGVWAVRRCQVVEITLPDRLSVGDTFDLALRCHRRVRGHVIIELEGATLATGDIAGDEWAGVGTAPKRGVFDRVEVRFRSAALPGLVWWERRARVKITPVIVAPARGADRAPIERSAGPDRGDHLGAAGGVSGEVDGIRPWRDGDSEHSVHWPSSMRAGELLVHDRRAGGDQFWVVRLNPRCDDLELEAGRVRASLEAGLRQGVATFAAIGDGEPTRMSSPTDIADWTARLPRDHTSDATPDCTPTEPTPSMSLLARFFVMGATVTSLATLAGALGHGLMVQTLLALVSLTSATASWRFAQRAETMSSLTRTGLGLASLGAFLWVITSSAEITNLLSILRGPLPELLVLLVLIHGLECTDRRALRVELAFSAVMVVYAAGFRVDGAVGWWLGAWAVLFAVAMVAVGGGWSPLVRTGPRAADRNALGNPWRGLISGLAGAAVVLGVLSLVPIPDGPTRLTLPTVIDDIRRVGSPGGLALPDGSAWGDGDGTRSTFGQLGGYPGFAQTLDTSVRGDLGNDVVMRVRADAPDFWRGQTFAEFDGRTWYADDDEGTPRDGPDIGVAPTLGDVRVSAVETEEFVQTYYVEADLPNVVYAASQAQRVIIDATVWTRPDGALRSDVVLTSGSIYTVVSERALVTAEALRSQGDVADRLSAHGRRSLARYLDLPQSTSAATIELADALAAGSSSTYDTIRAYETWLNQNVVYDLDAPVPAEGVDAVDDLLFTSRRGFCEQIATTLTMMLRSQGVPARLATGYTAGERDQVSGVWKVRASDAHAWVEVFFPETGWQSFDPTASVPLAGEVTVSTIGADVLQGLASMVADHGVPASVVTVCALLLILTARSVRRARRRRRRGRWGVLQDRFVELGAAQGINPNASNLERARQWHGDTEFLASALDSAAFDPGWVDEDEPFERARTELQVK